MGYEYIGLPDEPQREGQGIPSQARGADIQQTERYEEPSYREHVSRPLPFPGFLPTPAPTQPLQAAQSAPSARRLQDQSGQQASQSHPGQYGSQGQPQYPPTAYNGYNGNSYPSHGQQGNMPTPGYGYPPYVGYGGYPPQSYGYGGYAPFPAPYGYPGYPPYAYYPHPYYAGPAKPRRDTYLFVMAILSTIGSSLAFLGGLFCILGISISMAEMNSGSATPEQAFGSLVIFVALAIAGLAGGGFGLYHSIRSLARRPSAQLKLPWFWLFLSLYIVIILIALFLRANGLAISNIPVTISLIALAGILPALTILSLGVRRLHLKGSAHWPTRWRRFTLAIVSGATSAIVLASIGELILTLVTAQAIGLTGSLSSIDNPNAPIPMDPRYITFLLILVSVIAPLVEEGVKPLAVISMIGRIESAAEAFVLGLACGIGFDLIETSGYISQGYQNWVDVALQRSTAGLLHGFGAAMVSLGWYFITHRKGRNNSVLLGLGCITYAVLQHAIWNGSFVLQLLPDPIGPYLANGTIGSGSFAVPSFLLVYIILSALMLVFFLFVTGRIRPKQIDKMEIPTVTPTQNSIEGRREMQGVQGTRV